MQRGIIGEPAFIRLWIGSTASGFSTWGLTFLLGLAMTQGEISGKLLGITLGVRTVAFLVGVVIGGNLADQRPRRLVILWSSLVAAVGIPLIMLAMQLSGWQAIIIFCIGSSFSGFGQGGCRPAYQAIVPTIVPADQRKSANAAMGLSVRFSILIGPALTSILALTIGLTLTFFILFVTWLISAIAPPWVEEEQSASSKTSAQTSVYDFRQFLLNLQEGVEEARQHPWIISTLAALTAIIATGYSATSVILPIISEAKTGGGSLLTAAMMSYTFGGIVGAFIIARLHIKRVGWAALVSMALYSFVPLGLFLGGNFYMVIALYLLAGIGIEIFNVLWFTALQNEVNPDKLARVSSLDFLCSYGLAPVGLSLIEPMTQWYGTQTVLIVCWAVCLGAPLLAMLTPSSQYYSKTIPDDASVASKG